MSIQFNLTKGQSSIIKVIGVGGGGSNSVNQMHEEGIHGVNYIICNTDAQALEQSNIPLQIQLGPDLTEGRGAGSKPDVGRNATLESIDEIKSALGNGTKMLFITAGMGGGTGTGGAPMVARAAREMGILTVGIVTSPFSFEGPKRLQHAEQGIKEMKESVDTLIVISNDKLRSMYGNLSISEAFNRADQVVATAARGIAEIITVPGYIPVDFEDVNTVMRNSGVAVMGIGVAEGEDRAVRAIEAAIQSPLLDIDDISGAEHILLNITSGKKEVTFDEITEITDYIQAATGGHKEMIWGNCTNPDLEEKLCVTIIATGFDSKRSSNPKIQSQSQANTRPQRRVFSLDDEATIEPNTPSNSNSKSSNAKPIYNIEENAPTLEYKKESAQNLSQPAISRRKPQISNNSRYFKPQPKPAQQDQPANKVNTDRKNRLLSLETLENEPAYKRRDIKYKNVPRTTTNKLSKYNLSEEKPNQPEISQTNTHLYNQVD